MSDENNTMENSPEQDSSADSPTSFEDTAKEAFPEAEAEKSEEADSQKKGIKRVRDRTPKKKKPKTQKIIEKKREREENKRLHPNAISYVLGIVVLIFAVLGIVLTAWNSVRYIRSTRDTGSEFARYNEYLTPIAAVDPDPFDDITGADTQQLLDAAIWFILSADSTPDTYSYSGGDMIIPAADVASAYASLFGPEASIVHSTVQGYNCTFVYDSVNNVYRIPVTAITPIYTPRVTDVSQSGDSIIITVNYLASESWDKDSEGNFIAPSPDKVMRITLRELQGVYHIGAIQTMSATVPETISFEAVVTAPPTEEGTTETTTAAQTQTASPEITTLGGRVN